MANPASALGEAIGKSLELEIQKIIKEAVKPYGLYVDIGGPRPGIRKGKKILMLNDTGNQYQIDTVVEDENGDPLILIESKYLRYTKHNRDKGSWTCVAHYKIRTTYPTVKRSLAILIGNWTRTSIALMESFGVEVLEIPFNEIVLTLQRHSIIFDWDEKDSETPKESWSKYQQLTAEEKVLIARECIARYKQKLEQIILESVLADPSRSKNVESIELLIKTTHNEFYVKRFESVIETIKYLVDFTSDVNDLKGIIDN